MASQPEKVRFEDTKRFAENCETFLAKLDVIDADMASILRDNWDVLVTVIREGERDAKARVEFNSSVATSLDALVEPVPYKEGA